MLLINEKGKLTDYNVQFKNDEYTRQSVELKLIELLSNPITIEKKEELIKSSKPEVSCQMEHEIDSPLIKQTDFIRETMDRTTRTISYDTPFTIAFLWNKSLKKWGFNPKKSWYNDYLDLKAKTTNTDNLSLLVKTIEKTGKLEEFYADFLTNPIPMVEIFAKYPDVAHFITMFQLTEFSELGYSKFEIVANYRHDGYDESHMDKLSRLVDLAENNTKILRTLNLQPNIIK